MPILLELFSGTQSVSKVAKELGWETLSLDICPKHNPDLCMNILSFNETDFPPDYFDFIWASCPCEAYSVARARPCRVSRDDAMNASDPLVAKTRAIIAHFDEAEWCIENPAFSRLWQRDVARGLLEMSTITSYCCWGFPYRKNTRLASSFALTLPRCPGPGHCPMMVGRSHLEHAQRGRGGHLGTKEHSRDELHRIPPGLCAAILELSSLNPTPAPAALLGGPEREKSCIDAV